MPIDFDRRRWDKVAEAARGWWAGELDRPLMQVRLVGGDPGRPEPDLPANRFVSHYDRSVPAEQIVDRWDYDLSRTRFVGDAFPNASPNIGAGAVAAFLGAKIHNTDDTSWFVATEDLEVGEISLEFDANEAWLNRTVDIFRAAVERWQGAVQLDMVDLGGSLDVLTAFRPSDRLMFDLYDNPDEVERLNWQIHGLWMGYFEIFNKVLQATNKAYTTWVPILSEDPWYMIQSGFSSSIGPDMFERFVIPQIEETCKALPRTFFHLDGSGQLVHLDSLLEIDELNGLQWTPGDEDWDEKISIEVFRRIRVAGKLVHFGASEKPPMERFERIVDALGSGRGLVWIYGGHIDEEDELSRFIEKYGAL